MKATTLQKIRESLRYGYLPADWHSQKANLVKTESDFYALHTDCTEINGYWYHSEQDSSDIAYDEERQEYILDDDAVICYGRRGREITAHQDDCVLVGSEWYHNDYLSSNDIVYCDDDDCYHHRDDLYYWESDGCYHLEEEEDNNDLWGYGDGYQEKNFVREDAQPNEVISFGFGMEIEKNEMPSFYFNKEDVYYSTGAVMEEDGSVSSGFELKTPVYNLMSPKTDERLLKLKKFCDIGNVENAGGHIGFSMSGVNDEELLDLCSGFVPLIFAMYKKRLQNSYCEGRTIEELKRSGDKMQAIRMRGNYLEFRVIASVKTYETAVFRLNFFRIMAQNLGKNFSGVMGMATNPTHPLHKLLTADIYKDTDKFERLIKDAIDINAMFGKRKLTIRSINKINLQLLKLKTKCA